MGSLKCASVDLNDPKTVQAIMSAVQGELNKTATYFSLRHSLPSYFSTPGHTLTFDPG
jgi:hypothetical protein